MRQRGCIVCWMLRLTRLGLPSPVLLACLCLYCPSFRPRGRGEPVGKFGRCDLDGSAQLHCLVTGRPAVCQAVSSAGPERKRPTNTVCVCACTRMILSLTYLLCVGLSNAMTALIMNEWHTSPCLSQQLREGMWHMAPASHLLCQICLECLSWEGRGTRCSRLCARPGSAHMPGNA